jgi:hypothetical protein
VKVIQFSGGDALRKLSQCLLLTNVVLVTILAWDVREHFGSMPASRPERVPAIGQVALTNPGTGAVAPAGHKSKRFDWRLLSLPDLHQAAAALRAIGCPASTVEDIIVAEVNRRFARRERAARARYDDYELWEAPPADTAEALQRRTQLRDLFNQKRALLTDLLGPGFALDTPPQRVPKLQPRLEAALLTLPQEKRERVRSIQTEYADRIEGPTGNLQAIR